MDFSRSVSKRFFGPLYWIPLVLGILAVFYTGVCFAGYWNTGKLAPLAIGVYAAALALTLLTIEFSSYIVSAVNAGLALLDVVIVVRSSQWPLLYLAFMCMLFSGIAALPRNARVTPHSDRTK